MVMSMKMPPESSNVTDRRRRGIAADDVHQAWLADFAARHRLADTGEVGVEAAVESDLKLHACGFDRSQGVVDLFQAESDRLLAEDMLAGFGGRDDEIGVGIGRRADQHRFDCRVVKNLSAGDGDLRNAAMSSQRLRGFAVHVRNGDDLRLQANGRPGFQHERGRCGRRR